MQNAAAETTNTLEALTGVLIDTLRALEAAGEAEASSRLAGRAYVALRRDEPVQAQRVNALMHRLTRNLKPRREPPMSTTERQLDVRVESPARRHALIFETYEQLEPSSAFVLVNDHDPKPLYYQFAAEHPGRFVWEYLEEGPEVWRVRIGRTEAS